MRHKKLSLALLGLVLAATTAGCGKQTDTKAEILRDALRRTEQLSHKFLYEETFTDNDNVKHETTVRGLIEDDFRYKVRLSVDKKATIDEVAADDALAVRMLDPARLVDFLRRPETKATREDDKATTTTTTAPSAAAPVGAIPAGVDPIAALQSRRWVLDDAGAPASFGESDEDRAIGEDPILDSLDIFAYVEQAIGAATRIAEYDSQSLDPVYKKDEDPFPPPAKGSGIIRYDFGQPKLPRASDTSGGNQATPEPRHFRKMAVYMKDDRVVQIREVIDVESRLDDLQDIYDVKVPKGIKKAQFAAIAVGALNKLRQAQGDPPIRLRTMSYKLDEVAKKVTVEMPTDTVEANLAVLAHRGAASEATTGAQLAAPLLAQP